MIVRSFVPSDFDKMKIRRNLFIDDAHKDLVRANLNNRKGSFFTVLDESNIYIIFGILKHPECNNAYAEMIISEDLKHHYSARKALYILSDAVTRDYDRYDSYIWSEDNMAIRTAEWLGFVRTEYCPRMFLNNDWYKYTRFKEV